MNNLQECINEYMKDGYTRNYAISKVCQDIIINRIYNSKYRDRITVKGGVVMFHLTQNIRRATIDMDIDFINMSIATNSIVNVFIELEKLNNIDEFKLEIDNEKIEELSHEDYHGKRLAVKISDKYKNCYQIKLDIGVHKYVNILQDKLLLNTKIIEDNVSFLINPKEQIFVEKLIPLLKFGPLSTRFRDIFDLYWLISKGDLDRNLVNSYTEILIFNQENNINNKEDIFRIINLVFNDNLFIKNLSNNNNWTGQNIFNILDTIKNYIVKL